MNIGIKYLLAVLIMTGGIVTSDTFGVDMDKFCDVFGDSPSQRIDKIVRIFRLQFKSAEEMKGEETCPNGESFKLTNSCVGDYRVAVLSISNDKNQKHLSSASRIIHLYKIQNGRSLLLNCIEQPEE